ncbi:MAG: CBS domain-containing protein [Ignavibacteriales bacterium]|nr:CBS domain-containing protein [Ignavibacteriales bacterium]
MNNTIPHRIYDFLKEHPPFNFISKEILLQISQDIIIIYSEKNDVIFKQGYKPPDYFYVVREGAVKLFNEFKNENILIDVCDEGDIFGIRPLISEDRPYTLTAKVSEEALIYKIPTGSFLEIMKLNKNVENYFSSSFTGGIRNPYSKYSKQKYFDESLNIQSENFNFFDIQKIPFGNLPITCALGSTIRNAAMAMKEKKVGSIVVVDETNKPIGIITDKDLRNKVVAGEVASHCIVEDIMSSPVITSDRNATAADLQILMIKNNIHHICVTEDGTTNSKMIGMISEHDILILYGNNPSVLIREINRAKNSEQLRNIRANAELLLRNYLQQEISIDFITRIITEINNAINIKAIDLTISELAEKNKELPNVKWCWLSLGSQGRGEQLLRSDQDNALVFDDVENIDYEKTKNYFLQLAKGVNDILEDCGFDYCPANVMASNPNWCLSLSEWNKQFESWIYSPGNKEVMYSTIFFDFNPLYGNFELSEKMSENIFRVINNQESFMSFLAKNAIENPPPLSFFRDFLVENNGEHKNEFDIKARAMMPLVDGARVLALAAGLGGINSTIKRFNKLAEIEPENNELFEQLADACEIIIRFRTMQGLKHNNTGRYFKPDELNKMQRLMLRNCFRPIKELQTILTVRFNLNMFR